MRCAALAVLALIVACGGPVAETKRQGGAGSPSAARRSVVVIISHRADGKTGFGSGVLLPASGDILTNRHVIEGATSLGVLFYDAKRRSYAAEDGGLGRYLFENEAAVQPAKLVRDSNLLDMALVHVAVDTTKLPKLTYRDTPVEPGEQVYAIGHPGESVWSITQGLVSAVHNGLVQTDAAISFGNSGGPLVDGEGRLVGINTSRLLGDIDGVGFARPVALVQAFIDDSAEAELDLSNPRAASEDCTRAVEIASSRMGPCLAVADQYEVNIEALKQAQALVGLPEPARGVVEARGTVFTRDEWMARYIEAIQAYIANTRDDVFNSEAQARGDAKAPLTRAVKKQILEHVARPDVKARLGKLVTATREDIVGAHLEAERLRTGKNFPDDGQALRQSIRMGTRVDEAVDIDANHAWILTAGRNPDGTVFREVEYWTRVDGAWALRYPRDDEARTLPSGWPRAETFADRVRLSRDMKIIWLLARAHDPDAS